MYVMYCNVMYRNTSETEIYAPAWAEHKIVIMIRAAALRVKLTESRLDYPLKHTWDRGMNYFGSCECLRFL